ncbi:hypothetical protein [Novosphingobium sp.]|uniref:hypothetical protein n=1 Tax=Novosphingobium sp. TaxID=1874826 RepID=UPI002C2762E3|nr:hypothetical protein [Novosphingobium sp.]HQV04929.1 hypothetical protein [Novosphingobium sp.]
MSKCKFKLTGSYKVAVGIVEDHRHGVQMVDFQSNTAEAEVLSGGLAWFTLNASGDMGDRLEISVTTESGRPACPDHSYAFNSKGKIARPFQFNPDA